MILLIIAKWLEKVYSLKKTFSHLWIYVRSQNHW